MKKGLLLLVTVLFAGMMGSCKKDDNGAQLVPPRDLAEQYATDIADIEEYLQTHYMVVGAENRVSVFPIPEGGSQTPIWDQTQYPLQHRIVKNDSRLNNLTDGRVDDPVDYKLYYIILNEGGGERPSKIDSTYVSYRGWKISDNTQFDEAVNPFWFTFETTAVSGFRQFSEMLNTAENFEQNTDGTTTFSNYGSGVVFIPSGLAYFNAGPPAIGSYQPLVFQINMMTVRRRDHDRDGIPSYLEMYNGQTDPFLQDTDGNRIPDFLDIDDDGDGHLTRNEIRGEDGQPLPFELIPDCDGNTTDPNRLRKHLDPSCH